MARILMEGITIGADPELFIQDKDTGEFVCPDGLIPGTKSEPYPVEGGAVQQDGFAAEFNIDPCTTYTEFSERVTGVKKQLQKMLPSNLKLVAQPTATFSEEEWDKASDATKALGCSPDYNAWSLKVNAPPNAQDRVRCAGGHIHIGWTEDADTLDKEYVKSCVDLVRQLDWCLGGWSVIKDTDSERRKMYGKAGSMRFKPYGVEYRTLSNFWLRNHSILPVIWNRLCGAIDQMANHFYPEEFVAFNQALIESINTSNVGSVIHQNSTFNTPIRTAAPIPFNSTGGFDG